MSEIFDEEEEESIAPKYNKWKSFIELASVLIFFVCFWAIFGVLIFGSINNKKDDESKINANIKIDNKNYSCECISH